VLKAASSRMDHCVECQTQARSFQHFMRAPGESSAQAKQDAQNFIKAKESQARSDNGKVSTAQGIGDPSLETFGQALHTSTDGTSPAHVDADGNPRVWQGLPITPSRVQSTLKHIDEEAHPTQQQLNNAVNAARRAFGATYGASACAQASGGSCGH
jgi:hypothetical protein